ncbi:MAG: hypothetical protein KDI79_27750, partial [Anaerolineae bacterium]|nr:hypothetical protein [Anaerolineae bacterium]
LYTLCPDPDTRTRFINTLLAGGQGSGVGDQGFGAGGQESVTDDQPSPISQSPNLPISNLQSPISNPHLKFPRKSRRKEERQVDYKNREDSGEQKQTI